MWQGTNIRLAKNDPAMRAGGGRNITRPVDLEIIHIEKIVAGRTLYTPELLRSRVVIRRD